MGFRANTYATVWSVEPVSATMTKGRISISRKNKQTGQYEQDFSGYVSFIGTATAQKALGLKEKDRIKIGDVDVSNRYDKEKHVEYTTYKIFTFDFDGEPRQAAPAPIKAVDDGEQEPENFPF